MERRRVKQKHAGNLHSYRRPRFPVCRGKREDMREIFERRSTRKYQDRPVEPEKIRLILQAGMCAPSAGNEKPWHFVVVEEREELIKLSKLHPHAAMLPEAAFAVILCADPSLQKYRFDFWIQDCSAAAALFNASLEESLSNEEQKKAFSETVLRIKKNSLDHQIRHAEGLDELQKLIRDQAELANLHISLD